MKKEVGLWVDHRKAIVVIIKGEVEETQEIKSNMEKHIRFSDGEHSKATSPQGSTAEDMRDRQFGDHLSKYYDGVISKIRDADAIWIFGPGEAKGEFRERLERENLGDRIVGIETVDKMTVPQIAAKVRQHYHK